MYNVDNTTATEFSVPGGKIYKAQNTYISWSGRGSTQNIKYSKVIRSEKKDDEIIIYEKAGFLFVGQVAEIDSFMLKTSNINSKIAETVKSGTMPYKENKEFYDTYLEKNLNDFNTFKHTFKTNGTTFYWYSTEVVNN